jgi:transcription initiation factor TFIID TATA-box-binding protein
MDIVNIVAVGYYGQELDLEALSADLETYEAKYDPQSFPGLQIRLEPEGAVLLLFSSGKCTITGAKTRSEVDSIFCKVLSIIRDLGLNLKESVQTPDIKNIVCKGDLKRDVDLAALTIALGMELTEYEPEQSPFVYYWPKEIDCLITIPSNGEIIVTGIKKTEDAERALVHLKNQVESYLPE